MAEYIFTGATNSNWGTITNWFNQTTGLPATSLPTSIDDVIFDASSPNCTVNTSARVCKSLSFEYYTNTITMSFGITVSGNFVLGSAMFINGTGAITVNANSTIASFGKTWPNALNLTGATTLKIFADDFTVDGLLTISACAIQADPTKAPNAKIIANNGLNVSNIQAYPTSSATGTTITPLPIYLRGGTFTAGGLANLLHLYIDGNVKFTGGMNISGNDAFTIASKIVYVSGNVDAGLAKLYASRNITLNTGKNLVFNEVSSTSGGQLTFTLEGDLHTFIFAPYKLSGNNVIKTSNEKIYVYGGLYPAGGGINSQADIYLRNVPILSLKNSSGGGNPDPYNSGEISPINANVYLEGDVKFMNTIKMTGGSINYVYGNIDTSQLKTFYIEASISLNGFNNIPLPYVNVTKENLNVTMDEFFTGTPNKLCDISCFNNKQFTVTFTTPFEKIAKFVSVTNCTVSRPQQLIILTNQKFNTNIDTNVGIRYRNLNPNGFSKNESSQLSRQTGLPGGLVGDPNFIK